MAAGVADAGFITIGAGAVARAAAAIVGTAGDPRTIGYALAHAADALFLGTWARTGTNPAAAIVIAAVGAIALRFAHAHATRTSLTDRTVALAGASTTVGLAASLAGAIGGAGLAVAKDAYLGLGAIAALAGVYAFAVYAQGTGVAGNVGARVFVAGALNANLTVATDDAVAGRGRKAANRAGVAAIAGSVAGHQGDAGAEVTEFSLSTIRTETRRGSKASGNALAFHTGFTIGTVETFAGVGEWYALLPTHLARLTGAVRGQATVGRALAVKTHGARRALFASRLITIGYPGGVGLAIGPLATGVYFTAACIRRPASAHG